jgi:RimJ/RimL family protein N-acetyltransferase
VVQTDVSRWYPETEVSYGASLVRAQRLNSDPYGLFTLRRTVWSVLRRGEVVGFFVASEKRGGSVKLGPIAIGREHRRSGLATEMLSLLANYYRSVGARKLYMTVADPNLAAVRTAGSADFRLEATLVRQYSVDHDELVFGLALRSASQSSRDAGAQLDSRCSRGFDQLIDGSLSSTYGEIDRNFTTSLFRAGDPVAKWGPYDRQPRRIFLAGDSRSFGALIIAAPKRGGAVKIGPVAGVPDLVVPLVERAITEYEGLGKRRIYALVPCLDVPLGLRFEALGFASEGRLREPYRTGVDVTVLGRRLSPAG